ncbi:hypothetical protein HK103_000508 [Boothiomyces macroporosus]|uniref:Transmembrane protein n=1 Tax=Boothiomyces macroporosus TaxID=261099 RepID=A0AAD5UBP6_9FUNG|nr:hypothetical protein HK103_000508 [Boothiomyces macroporosus]
MKFFRRYNTKIIDSKDILNRFKKQEPVKLPFEPIAKPKSSNYSAYWKPFGIGVMIGAFLEFSMIQFGYYDALIQAERKRMLKEQE